MVTWHTSALCSLARTSVFHTFVQLLVRWSSLRAVELPLITAFFSCCLSLLSTSTQWNFLSISQNNSDAISCLMICNCLKRSSVIIYSPWCWNTSRYFEECFPFIGEFSVHSCQAQKRIKNPTYPSLFKLDDIYVWFSADYSLLISINFAFRLKKWHVDVSHQANNHLNNLNHPEFSIHVIGTICLCIFVI